jgi:hypothetical protein
MRDAFRKMRHFLMTAKRLSEDEAISLMSDERRVHGGGARPRRTAALHVDARAAA